MDDLRFSQFTLRPRTRQLFRSGKELLIGARAFDLLVFLIENRDRVVSRDEVMQVVWPDRFVGDNNLNVQVANLRKLLGTSAVITVAGRGLRFGLDVPGDDVVEMPLPDRPSVVVLPFTDLGIDPNFSWLADSVVEDVTTQLSRFRDLFVVARNSAFSYREGPRDLRLISKELGVRYVVEGSVRTNADQVLITAQLVDATSGRQVWAETFESDLARHLQMQTSLAGAIVTCLAPQIERTEAERIRSVSNEEITAHGIALRGWSVVSAGDMAYDPAPRKAAADLARQALEIDPQSSLAWRVLAWVDWWDAYHATTESIPRTVEAGIGAATNAIAADPTDHHARRLRGLLHFMNQNAEQGLRDLREANDLNPNCAVTLSWLGLYEGFHGDVQRGVEYAEAALRRSPRDPTRGSLHAVIGFTRFAVRDYEGATRAADAALAESANSATPLILGTIAKVGAREFEGAKDSFKKVKEIAPSLVDARLNGRWLSTNADYLNRAHTFFRVAAGLEPREAAENLLRQPADL